MTRIPNLEEAHGYYLDADNAAEQGDLAGAIRLIEKAVDLCPSISLFWAIKGHYLDDFGEYAQAKLALEKATQLSPKMYQAWGELGLVHRNLGQFEEAAACYKRSVALEEDFSTYTLLAAVEYEFDVEQAIIHAEKALQLNPDWDEAETVLAEAKKKRSSNRDH